MYVPVDCVVKMVVTLIRINVINANVLKDTEGYTAIMLRKAVIFNRATTEIFLYDNHSSEKFPQVRRICVRGSFSFIQVLLRFSH